MKFFLKLLIYSNVFIGVLTLCAYLSSALDSQMIWIFSIPGLFYPILFLLNIACIVLWLLTKPKYAIISVFTILLGFNHIGTFINFNKTEVGQKSGAIELVSFNIQNGHYAYSKGRNNRKARSKTLRNFLKKFKDKDVLCFQESAAFAQDILDLSFKKHFKYQPFNGPVILSKSDFIDKGSIDFNTLTNGCIWTDIAINFDTIRIYNAHLQSNRISKKAQKVMSDGSFQDKETWDGIYGIFANYKRYNQIRSKQIKLIKQHMEKCPYPIILCGDLNDTTQSYIYRLATEDLTDSFREKGNGLGTTFAGALPLLRIDYILGSQEFEFLNHEVHKEEFSDHFLISATLRPIN